MSSADYFRVSELPIFEYLPSSFAFELNNAVEFGRNSVSETNQHSDYYNVRIYCDSDNENDHFLYFSGDYKMSV